MTKTRIAVGCLGLLLGGGVGLVIGGGASYAIAELITPSRETQAYLAVLIVPALALIGGVTLALTLLGLAAGSLPRLALSIPGWLLLGGALLLAVRWSRVARPAELSVRNETATRIESLYLGGDFRRNTRIGDIAPGESSAPVTIDLDRPLTFSALEGRCGNDQVRHWLAPEEREGLPDGDYLWIVGGEPGALTYRFEAAP
jgi:hypothetical protein